MKLGHMSVLRGLTVLVAACFGLAAAQEEPRQQRCFVQRPLDRLPATDRSAMCQALEDNLNDFCAGPSPMCGLRFSSGQDDFRLPDWESLDVTENLALLENMVRGRAHAAEIRNRGVGGYEWSLIKDGLGEPTDVRLKSAQVDIMNRGVPERVYEFWPNTCDASIGPDASARILLERHAQIMTNPEWKAAAERGELSFPVRAGNSVRSCREHRRLSGLFVSEELAWGGSASKVIAISSAV
jgi:hypothetical protein